jgi:DNA repair exonuclease SbcCD ATPase subunit
VKNLLLSTVTPFLNERANIYMDQLSRSTASIRIKTQKAKKGGGFSEKLDFRVTYNNAGSLYGGKSGGEKRRADLAILFAFADLAATRALAPIELRLLDEIFENLDALGCEQVMELLHEYIVPRAKTVLIVTHNETFQSLFEQRITVVKENGVSRIVETR